MKNVLLTGFLTLCSAFLLNANAQNKAAFLSTYASLSDLQTNGDDDEAAAATWFVNTYEGEFISTQSLPDDLSQYSVIWIAIDRVQSIENSLSELDGIKEHITAYYKAGGNLLLTTHAVAYLYELGRFNQTLSGSGPQGAVETGDGGDNSDIWYATAAYGTWAENPVENVINHSYDPIYAGLEFELCQRPNGVKYPRFPLVGAGYKENHNCFWHLDMPNPYGNGNPQKFLYIYDTYKATPLATWNDVGDYYGGAIVRWEPWGDFQGTAITIGIGAYEWNQNIDGANPYQYNIERLTKNALDELRQPSVAQETKKTTLIYDGETVSPTWSNIGGDGGAMVTNNEDNPHKEGINTSDKVIKVERAFTNEPFEGARVYGQDINPGVYNRISVMAWKDVPGDLKIELQRNENGDEVDKWTSGVVWHGGDGWQRLTFAIHPHSAVINHLLIFVHAHDEKGNSEWGTHDIYLDNIEAYFDPQATWYAAYNASATNEIILYDGEDGGLKPWFNDLAATVDRDAVNAVTDGINSSTGCASITRRSYNYNDGEDHTGGTDRESYSGGVLWGWEKVYLSPKKYNRFTLMVLKSLAGPVQLEIQQLIPDVKGFFTAEYTTPGEWQKLTFDVSGFGGNIINNILIEPHFTTFDGDDISVYWDNLTAYTADIIVNEDLEISADEAYSNNITVAAGKKLTVADNATLTANSLTLKSDAENGTATFVNNGTAIIKTANVEQYLSTEDGNREWYYLASPVTGASSKVFGEGNKIGHYDETTTSWTSPYSDGTPLEAGKGYVVKLDAPALNSIYTFAGTLNDGDVLVPVTRTGTTAAKRGFNLVGNPYPSYLNWDAVAKTSVQNTIWTRAFEGSEMVFKTYNAGVQEGDDDQTNGHIAPLQAFWVKVPADKADENDLTVEFTNTLRLHKVEGDANLRASKANNRPLIRLQISNGVISDKTVILFDGNAQNGFDAYDSEKMSNDNAAIPEICTSVDGERLVINSLTAVSDDLEIPLGIKTGTAGTFGISAVTLQNLEAVTLIDKVEDCEFDLSAGEAYEFASGVTDNAERFVLAFRAPQTPTGLSQSGTAKVLIYSNGNQIIITGAKNLSLVEVFNVAGQKLVGEQTHSAFYILHSTFSKGVYFVKVGNETSKIIVE